MADQSRRKTLLQKLYLGWLATDCCWRLGLSQVRGLPLYSPPDVTLCQGVSGEAFWHRQGNTTLTE